MKTKIMILMFISLLLVGCVQPVEDGNYIELSYPVFSATYHFENESLYFQEKDSYGTRFLGETIYSYTAYPMKILEFCDKLTGDYGVCETVLFSITVPAIMEDKWETNNPHFLVTKDFKIEHLSVIDLCSSVFYYIEERESINLGACLVQREANKYEWSSYKREEGREERREEDIYRYYLVKKHAVCLDIRSQGTLYCDKENCVKKEGDECIVFKNDNNNSGKN